jgi:hypothetical protein
MMLSCALMLSRAVMLSCAWISGPRFRFERDGLHREIVRLEEERELVAREFAMRQVCCTSHVFFVGAA